MFSAARITTDIRHPVKHIEPTERRMPWRVFAFSRAVRAPFATLAGQATLTPASFARNPIPNTPPCNLLLNFPARIIPRSQKRNKQAPYKGRRNPSSHPKQLNPCPVSRPTEKENRDAGVVPFYYRRLTCRSAPWCSNRSTILVSRSEQGA